MELLGQLIQEKCEAKVWYPVKASRSGPSFSHLFFTDDLMFFAKANAENCVAISEVLDNFCSLFGQSVSEAKSRVCFSPNIDPSDKKALSDILASNRRSVWGNT